MTTQNKSLLVENERQKSELELLLEQRAERKAKADADLSARAEKLAIDDLKALDEAESKYGAAYTFGEEKPKGHRIAVVKTVSGSIVVRRPEPLIYKKWTGSKMSEEDNHSFVRGCLVYPATGLFSAIMEEQPAELQRCAMACAELAGARFEGIAGKS